MKYIISINRDTCMSDKFSLRNVFLVYGLHVPQSDGYVSNSITYGEAQL